MTENSREPPSLQALVLAHGTFDKIPPKAWQAFNAEMAEWKAKVRYGELNNAVDRLQLVLPCQAVHGKT